MHPGEQAEEGEAKDSAEKVPSVGVFQMSCKMFLI